jgi:hypothetical protein
MTETSKERRERIKKQNKHLHENKQKYIDLLNVAIKKATPTQKETFLSAQRAAQFESFENFDDETLLSVDKLIDKVFEGE